MRFREYLFKPIDNTPIILWRIVFGLIMFFETWGAIAVGWVKQVYIDPPLFTFNFIGFEFLQPLPGYGMYVWFGLLGIFSLGVIFGYRYRLSIALLTIGWLGVYLMHKTSYNNHHYLMSLLCLMMCVQPAGRALSLDVRQSRITPLSVCYNLYLQVFVWLFLIVFFYAAIAKIYPDWLQGTPLTQWLSYKRDTVIGFLYQSDFQALLMSWGGIFFDLLVIPALLWKRTRTYAFWISVYFHVMNSITFQIGTFPFMMIGACVLFYPADKLRKWFRIRNEYSTELDAPNQLNTTLISVAFILFFAVQILLPLRHYTLPGNVFWTEEGHRLSWRMMLRSKTGTATFRILKTNGTQEIRDAKRDMTYKQYHTMTTHPDMIWQYCQFLKTQYTDKCEIYARVDVRLNFRTPKTIIDPTYNMSKAKWHLFQHEEWITEGPKWEEE
jgi:vitamin K-dependent gamma-carboxylase